jgi:YVTN family beta-propeller protein
VQITPDGKFAYVDIYGQHGGVWVIDLAARSTVTVVHLATEAFGGAITPDGRFVFATELDLAKVVVISTATNSVAATVSVGNFPNDVAVTPDSSKAFVTNQGDTTISVISIPPR